MNNNVALINWILFGDFGLLTLTPKYLLFVLFPIMFLLRLLSQLISSTPHIFIGLGCTTAALVSISTIKNPSLKNRTAYILVLLVPCSAQLGLIATYASLVSLRILLCYLTLAFIYIGIIYFIIMRLLPNSKKIGCKVKKNKINPILALKEGFDFTLDTAPAFAIGSVIISILLYFGLLSKFSNFLVPLMNSFLHLPKEASDIFVLNILKRDFGSASLINMTTDGSFNSIQLTVLLLMLTFFVPCFNSQIILIKQFKLPKATGIWLGSLIVSLLIGKISSIILSICIV